MFKKISLLAVLVLVLSIFLYLKPSFPRSFHHFFTPSTNLTNENINGLYLFDNINDDKFLKIYSKPTNKSQDNEFYKYFKIQDGVVIATNHNGEIVRFIIGTGIPTAKGIEMGDSIKKVKALYGRKYYKRLEQGVDIIGYVDKKHHQSLEFWYDPQNNIIMY